MSNTTQKPDGIEWAAWGRKTIDTSITWRGETKTILRWAVQLGTSAKNLRERLQRMPLEVAMTPEKDNARRAEAIRLARQSQRENIKKDNLDYWFDLFIFGRYKHEKQNNA